MGLAHNQRLGDHVSNVPPQQGHINVIVTQVLVEVADWTLAAWVHANIALVELIVFVDRVVGQVHVQVVLKKKWNLSGADTSGSENGELWKQMVSQISSSSYKGWLTQTEWIHD